MEDGSTDDCSPFYCDHLTSAEPSAPPETGSFPIKYDYNETIVNVAAQLDPPPAYSSVSPRICLPMRSDSLSDVFTRPSNTRRNAIVGQQAQPQTECQSIRGTFVTVLILAFIVFIVIRIINAQNEFTAAANSMKVSWTGNSNLRQYFCNNC